MDVLKILLKYTDSYVDHDINSIIKYVKIIKFIDINKYTYYNFTFYNPNKEPIYNNNVNPNQRYTKLINNLDSIISGSKSKYYQVLEIQKLNIPEL